jgi:hypothetical protein
MSEQHERDVAEVDEFLAGPKRLVEDFVDWTESSRPGELMATWNIEDPLGIRSHLRFRLNPLDPSTPSVSVVFRRNAVIRLDIDDPGIAHPNPLWASGLGLPPLVHGSHCHDWALNRDYVLRSRKWELPARAPIGPALRRVPQMLPWIADHIGLDPLTQEQRQFDIPPRGTLI